MTAKAVTHQSPYYYQNELTGENISLRIIPPERAREVLEFYLRNRGELEPVEPGRHPDFYTESFHRRLLIEKELRFRSGQDVPFGLFFENRLIGKVQLSNIIRAAFQSAFLGYAVDTEFQNQGYAKEGVRLLIDHAFDDLKLHRIEASALPDNLRSQAVLKSCGFIELGLNKRYLHINGRWQDHYTYYLTNEMERTG